MAKKKAKKKATRKKVVKKTAHRISDAELNKARKMTTRRSGVTRMQLAERLDITVSRASQILSKIKATGSVPEKPVKGANRTLVFTT